MYLKSLEINGFKSFANRTVLQFKPGLMAIVGPNGCGKSNICDAIRWVMGESSAKALRGTKMEDVIFNGTDTKKPLGMAEVNMTFADCESTLGTEFHEVTITRRVMRSGENHYLINKARCRRKDIQKLFLDTGMGTMSYSMLQQGHIDLILSSRPEDRRAIFEEASGINRYKIDKKEAIRKLEQTEANLLRLDDVVREVKRQIGSLQRQAGKARRYKTFSDELRSFEVYVTQQDVRQSDAKLTDIETKRDALQIKVDELRTQTAGSEAAHTELQQTVTDTETKIGTAIETAADARADLERAEALIKTNTERVAEYEQRTDRDSRDVQRARESLSEQREIHAEHTTQLESLVSRRTETEGLLEERNTRLSEHEAQMSSFRQEVQTLRGKIVESEAHVSSHKNDRMQLESREGANVIRRERLAAEQTQLARQIEANENRAAESAKQAEQLEAEQVERRKGQDELQAASQALRQTIDTERNQVNGLQSQIAAKTAKHELLSDESHIEEELPGGARAVLDDANPLEIPAAAVQGLLASHIEAKGDYAVALETVLRSQLDAIVVSDADSALAVLQKLSDAGSGPARVHAAQWPSEGSTAPEGPGTPLIDQVKVSDAATTLAQRLLGHVRVVDRIADLPKRALGTATFVSRDGGILRADGTMEYWVAGDAPANPLSRRHAAAQLETELAELQTQLATHQTNLDTAVADQEASRDALAVLRKEVDDAQVILAVKKSEAQTQERDLTQGRERLETVRFEAEQIEEQGRKYDARREDISSKLNIAEEALQSHKQRAEELATSLHEMETKRSDLYAEVTERKVEFTEVRQRFEHLQQQKSAVEKRIAELDEQIQGQDKGIESYQTTLDQLRTDTEKLAGSLDDRRTTVDTRSKELDVLRAQRAEQGQTLGAMEEQLSKSRAAMEEMRESLANLEVRQTETAMRRQNRLERVTGDYNVTQEELMATPEPDWGDEKPSRDDMDTRVAELRTKIEAMGPVNLVAIEEHHELEERYAFLTQQRSDLVNSKTQLMEMITKINETSSQLFSETFVKINENFQEIFGQFFGGGTAKLVLVNEEDVLDCGIEIIARPPGKRLQNVSLLSGGERTLTAVALLFSIYMIKPSPFCVLDELDAALDDTNIGRFVAIVQQFLTQSQFLIVTHNERTIAAADILYGVTMVKNTGISKLMSMRFLDHEQRDGDGDGEAEEPESEAAPSAS